MLIGNKIVVAFFFLVSPLQLKAQSIINAPLTKIASINGNSLANVRAITKDKFGFIWIGTQDGLFRFDGITAIMYNKNTNDLSHRILNNDISSLITSSNDSYLWVLNSFAGISKIDLVTGVVKNKILITADKKSNSNYIVTKMIEYNNNLYISAEEGYIFKFNKTDERVELVKKIEIDSKRKIEQLCVIGDKFLICFGGGDLMLFDSTFTRPLSQININKTKQDFHINGYCHDEYNKLVLATTTGIRQIDITDSNHYYKIREQPFKNLNFNGDILSISQYNSSFWITDYNTIYQYTDKGTVIKYMASKGPDEQKWLKAVRKTFFTGTEIWLGNEYGLAVLKTMLPPFVPYYQGSNSTTKLNHCNNIFVKSDSVVYSCATDGFYKINTITGAINTIEKGTYSLCAFKGPKNEVVFSNDKGTYILDEYNKPKLISKKYKELGEIDFDLIAAAESYKDSLIFIASQYEKGLYVYNIKLKKLSNINIHTTPLNLKSNVINSLVIKDDILWIVCDNSISCLNIASPKMTNYTIFDPTTKLPLNIIMDLCFVKNKIWLAVYGVGLVELNNNMEVADVYSTATGIQNAGLYKLFNSGDSLLITSSNTGLYSLNLRTRKIKSFFEEDGLHGNAFEESSGAIYGGRFIFGGVNGFTIVDPARIIINKAPPKVYFSKITIETSGGKNDTSNIEIKNLQIPDDVLQTTLFLSAINNTSSNRITFAWRIIENNKEWINIGAQNFIPLIGLPHGTYHLQIKAANEDGIWSEPKELVLKFLPKWYQTWLFYLAIAITVATILYALYRYRITQIKKQHEIRKNIATDLHDDLGSTLNSVKVFTNLAISGVKQEESLQQVKDNLTEATMSLRDMIWVLDDSLDTVDELITRLKQFAVPVASASNIEAIIKADSDVNSRHLIKEEKRNLFLICKEAINNSIKYSGATQINVDIDAYGKKIQIVITDNGKGFNVDEVKKGYGLKNMQYRAGQIKYKVMLISSLASGTRITIKPA